VKGSSYIFRGFASSNWDSTSGYKSDPNAFLFILKNRDNQPCKTRQTNRNYSIFFNPCYGPIFGSDNIRICNDANTRVSNDSFLGQRLNLFHFLGMQ